MIGAGIPPELLRGLVFTASLSADEWGAGLICNPFYVT